MGRRIHHKHIWAQPNEHVTVHRSSGGGGGGGGEDVWGPIIKFLVILALMIGGIVCVGMLLASCPWIALLIGGGILLSAFGKK